jgi:hypothetical protein
MLPAFVLLVVAGVSAIYAIRPVAAGSPPARPGDRLLLHCGVTLGLGFVALTLFCLLRDTAPAAVNPGLIHRGHRVPIPHPAMAATILGIVVLSGALTAAVLPLPLAISPLALVAVLATCLLLLPLTGVNSRPCVLALGVLSSGCLLPHVHLAVERSRERMRGVCRRCGYDLRGTAAAGRTTCPECGTAATTEDLAIAKVRSHGNSP